MTAHFSIALKDSEEAMLEALAQRDEVSPDVMLEKLVRDRLEYEIWYREKVQEGLDAIARGEVLDHEEVVARGRARRAELLERYGAE